MIIIYNPLPPAGSKIEGFRFASLGELAPHDTGELKQYDPQVAEELLKTFGFLQVKTPQEAQDILQKPKEAAFKCKYCEFSTDHKVALAGHERSHKEEIAKAKEPAVDPAIIPVAEATPIEPNRTISERAQDDLTPTSEGFYGPGLVEERKGIKARNVYS